ncbi:MAG: hypothetical protein OET16_12265, partial [Chromatiales bacterium]|nr:hypothetical protein [Chromatiales bacterium]
MRQQDVRLGGQNNVCRLVAHFLAHHRNRDTGEIAPKRLKSLQQRPVERGKKARDALHIEQMDKLIGGAQRAFCTQSLICHLHQGRLVVRHFHHPLELALLAFLGRNLQLHRTALQMSRNMKRPLDAYRLPCFGIRLEIAQYIFERTIAGHTAQSLCGGFHDGSSW